MMTVKQFAENRGIPVQTVYTWISRKQEKKNGFKVIKIGSVTMIKELNQKQYVALQSQKEKA